MMESLGGGVAGAGADRGLAAALHKRRPRLSAAGAGGVSVVAALALWLALLGVFLVAVPAVLRRRRVQSGQRVD